MKENKYLYKKDPNENYECESCSDHVCNDECGCQLSEAALKSLKKWQKNKKEE
ncbi:hypothetical protein ACJA28_02775 [Mesomycoplasma moatsii]|uniref:hypothetical protein n=1 Tax=Mesomycoplasma moatsii TaxID=171287 RepID=UPI0003B313B0